MLKKMFILLFLPFLIQLSAIEPSQIPSYRIGEVPSWVNLFEYDMNSNLSPSPKDKKHFQLIDKQLNWEEKTIFVRKAVKINSKKMIKHHNEFRIDYNPFFEQIILHSIRVFRHGCWMDYLPKAQLGVVPCHFKEYEEVKIDGIVIVYLLKDLEEGDLYEFQYSKAALFPTLLNHINKEISLSGYYRTELFSYRLLASPSHNPAIKYHNTDKTLNIQDLSATCREWSLTTHFGERKLDEPKPIIQLSEYPSWKAVVGELLPLLSVSDGFNDNLEIQAMIHQWMEKSQDPLERARLAVQFVQDEISTLGYLTNLRHHSKTDLNTVCQKGEGDTIDKTLLLQNLLKSMGIESTPVLTRRYYFDNKLRQSLPMPTKFNSAVLRIDFENKSLFIDPDDEDQTGPLENHSRPHFKEGLPLSVTSSDLISSREPQSAS